MPARRWPPEVRTGWNTRSRRGSPRKGLSLTQQIFVGLAVGIAAGWFVSEFHPTWAPYFRPFSQIFLRLIKMIIAPLIFATLVAGIAGAGHFKVVGRMGLRAIIYFEIVTTLALVIGLVAVNVMRPGRRREPADGPAVRNHRDPADVGSDPPARRCRSRSSRRWPRATCSRSSSSASCSRSRSGMIGEKGRPVIVWCEAHCRDDVQVHEHRHALRADWRRRGDRLYRRARRGGGPLQPGLAGRDALPRAGGLHARRAAAGRADLRRPDPQVRAGRSRSRP